MSHTPGPWQRCCQNKPRTCGYIFSADGQAYLAKVLELGDGVDPVCNDQDREANARLIAAAPDLLEALKECLSCEFACTDKAAINKAEIAIAKAEGK